MLVLRIFSIFELLSLIASIIIISIICHLSRNNPLEEHTIRNLNNYFNDVPDVTNLTTKIEKECNNNDKELDNIESNIKFNKSENNHKRFLRRLVSTSYCTKIRNKFEKYEGRKLSSIFDLKMGKIHKLSIGLIVVISFIPFCIILTIIFYKVFNCDREQQVCQHCSFTMILLAIVTNLVLLIIFAVIYKKGDIGEYKDFLDCPKIKKNAFAKFSDVTKLRKYIISFEIVDAIFDLFGILKTASDQYILYEKEQDMLTRQRKLGRWWY